MLFMFFLCNVTCCRWGQFSVINIYKHASTYDLEVYLHLNRCRNMFQFFAQQLYFVGCNWCYLLCETADKIITKYAFALKQCYNIMISFSYYLRSNRKESQEGMGPNRRPQHDDASGDGKWVFCLNIIVYRWGVRVSWTGWGTSNWLLSEVLVTDYLVRY